MTFRKPKRRLLQIACICLLVFLSACASTPQIIPAPCPPFPTLPPELMQLPPTLVWVPQDHRSLGRRGRGAVAPRAALYREPAVCGDFQGFWRGLPCAPQPDRRSGRCLKNA